MFVLFILLEVLTRLFQKRPQYINEICNKFLFQYIKIIHKYNLNNTIYFIKLVKRGTFYFVFTTLLLCTLLFPRVRIEYDIISVYCINGNTK